MRTILPSTELILKTSNIRIKEKLYLYKQYIDTVDVDILISTDEIYINGNYTSEIFTDDIIIFPLIDYTTERTVLSISYSTGITTITFSTSFLSSSYLGTFFAKKINITEYLTKDSVIEIDEGLERNLNQYDSGKIDITVDNSSGFFKNTTKNGILDDNNIFWFKYYIRFKNNQDEILRYSGLLDLADLQPNIYNKTLTFRGYGNMYELDRYPAYLISNESNKYLSYIDGIYIDNYIPSENSEEGVKEIVYEPFDADNKMKGITVDSVSSGTLSGIKVFLFRYPHYFKWDNGLWTTVATLSDTDGSSGQKKIYARNLVDYALVTFGDSTALNEYPDSDTELWVNITDDKNNISQQGMPTIIFDNGEKFLLQIHFQRVVDANTGGTVLEDITAYSNELPGYASTIKEIFIADDDYILIFASEIFFGLEIDMVNGLTTSTTIEISYGTGGDTFSSAMTLVANNLIDNTNGLLNSGTITWDIIDNWVISDIVADGGDTHYKGYAIKIKRVSATGSLNLIQIKRLLRIKGERDDYLQIKIDRDSLSANSATDEIVITYKNGQYYFNTWYNNISLDFLIKKALDKSNYSGTNIVIDDLIITNLDYLFNIWGKPPKFIHPAIPLAIHVDFENSVIYCGVGRELWKSTFQGEWEYIDTLLNDEEDTVSYTIKRLWKNGNYLYVLLIKDELTYVINTYKKYYVKFNLSTNSVVDKLYGYIYTMEKTYRNGGRWEYVDISDTKIYKTIGDGYQDLGGGFKTGENLTIAFQQYITIDAYAFLEDNAPAIFPAPSIDYNSNGSNRFTNGEFIFLYNQNFKYNKTFGWAYINMLYNTTSEKHDLGLGHSFGQSGVIIIDEVNNDIYIFTVSGTYYVLGKTNLDTMTLSETLIAYYNLSQVPICGVKIDDEIIYFGYTRWYDYGDNTKCYSYITKTKLTLKVENFNKVWRYNNTGAVYTDITTTINNGSSQGACYNEVNDAIYFGSGSKFRLLEVVLGRTSTTNTYIVEYWDGSAWTATTYQSDNTLVHTALSFDLPRDWTKVAVNGSQVMYYIRLRMTGYDAGGGLGLTFARMTEIILWDSELDNSGSYTRYMPLHMVYNPTDNIIYGSMFNRESTGADNFRWMPYIFDLNNNTCYFQNAGDNYTYDGTYLFKSFVYDSFNNRAVFAAENIRYKNTDCYLIGMTYNLTTHAIILTKLGIPVIGDWGLLDEIKCNSTNGNLYGITKDKSYSLFEYAKSYYPRIELAKFSESDSIRTFISDIAEMFNLDVLINDNRIIKFLDKTSYLGDFNILWDENINKKNTPEILFWDYYYDSVKINYENPFNKNKGNTKLGFSGWNKKILTIDNKLIQNIHIAKAISNNIFTFFNKYRLMPRKIIVKYSPQIEISDRFLLYIPKKICDVNIDKYFKVMHIRQNSDKSTEITGYEISDYTPIEE